MVRRTRGGASTYLTIVPSGRPYPTASYTAPEARSRRSESSVVAVHALTALVPFLRFDRQRRDRPRFETLQRNRLAGFLAIAISAVFDTRQRGVDLANQLALTVTGSEFDRPIGLRGCTVGDIRVILVLILKMLKGFLRFLKDVVTPVEQFDTKVFPLAFAHKRLFIG